MTFFVSKKVVILTYSLESLILYLLKSNYNYNPRHSLYENRVWYDKFSYHP